MSEDDRTIDADDGVLDDLKRLAAEVRSGEAAEVAGVEETVDADETTMEQLRRFATEARDASPDQSGTETFDIDQTPQSTSRPAAAKAPDPESSNRPALPPLQPPVHTTAAEPEKLSIEEMDDILAHPISEPPPVAPRLRDRHESVPVPATELTPLPQLDSPGSIEKGEGWRPPTRSVMPVDPEKNVGHGDGPWKTVAMVLGVVLAAVAAFVIFGVVTGDDPADDEPPTEEIGPEGSVPPGDSAEGER